MKRLRLSVAILSVLLCGVVFTFSCTEPTNIGASFIQESHLQIIEVDTLTVRASTFMLDSIQTDNASRLFIGSHRDDKLGMVRAKAFMNFSTNNAGTLLNSILSNYVKTTLVLVRDKYSYYDTLQNITVQVRKVTEEMKAAEDGHYYNHYSFKTDDSILGSQTFTPYPYQKDTLEINLDYAFGQDIFNKVKNGDLAITSNDYFQDYLFGLCVSFIDNPNGCIMGFKKTASSAVSPEIRVYYENNSVVPSKQNYLSFKAGNVQFMNTQVDRTGTALQSLTSQKNLLYASQTDNQSYLQCGVPLLLRLEVPYLKNLLLDNPNLNLVNAVINFWPVEGSQRPNTSIPTSLGLQYADFQNSLYSTATLTNTEISAFLHPDPILGRDIYYTMSIPIYINTVMRSSVGRRDFADRALAFTLPSSNVNSSFNRIYINASKTGRPINLKLYFVQPSL